MRDSPSALHHLIMSAQWNTITPETSEFTLLLLSEVPSAVNVTDPGPLGALHVHTITLTLPCLTDDTVRFAFLLYMLFSSPLYFSQPCIHLSKEFSSRTMQAFVDVFLLFIPGLHLGVDPLYLHSQRHVLSADSDNEMSTSSTVLDLTRSSKGFLFTASCQVHKDHSAIIQFSSLPFPLRLVGVALLSNPFFVLRI